MVNSIMSLKYGGEALPELNIKSRECHKNKTDGKANKVWLRTRSKIRRKLLKGMGY